MATAAHRYCLGRQSYIVGACLDWLRENWKWFSRNTRRVVLRDTLEALRDNRAGSETIDRPGWEEFVAWAWPELEVFPEDVTWVVENALTKEKDQCILEILEKHKKKEQKRGRKM